MAPVGAISSLIIHLAVVMVHNHNTVVVRMRVPVMAVLDDNGCSTRNGRRSNGDRSQRSNDTSKLLHRVLLLTSRTTNATFPLVFPLAKQENSERLFSLRLASDEAKPF
jgi:hypothetical protein